MSNRDLSHRYLRGPEAGEALRIIETLRNAGFVAYMAGGCVRDALLGKPPKDYDVATDATPDAVREVFGRARTLAFGASFGVIGVLPARSRQPSNADTAIQPTEVATFRSDGSYSDGRRPDSVHFGDAKHDALRRDFTINGLFYDPNLDEVIDFVGGEKDLGAGVLRTIGNPLERFGEDKLRMLRVVRFATTLGFDIDASTLRAVIEHADDIEGVSAERIGAEMRRVIDAPHAIRGLQHLIACGLHRAVMPEAVEMDLRRGDALLQNAVPKTFPLRLACLMTLLRESEMGLKAISRRWRLSNEETRQAAAAIKHRERIRELHDLPWSQIQPILIHRDAEMIVGLAGAIAAVDESESVDSGVEDVIQAREALGWPMERLNPPPLLTGDDLRELGLPAGPEYQVILRQTRNAQLDGELKTREEAIKRLGFQ